MGGNVLVLAQHGSPAEGSLDFALELAHRLEARVLITEHVNESICPAGSRGHRDVAQQDTAAYAHLEWLRQEARAYGSDVNIMVLRGELSAALHHALTNIDLLITLDPDAGIEIRRRSRMLALEAACWAGVPVLAVPPGWCQPEGRRLLIAFDGSDQSRATFPIATSIARALRWSILLLQVIPIEAARLPRHPEIAPLLRRLRDVVRSSLRAEAEALAQTNVEVATGVLVGSTVSSILRAARLLRSDMIVLGSSGRSTPLGRAPGSVATAVFLRSRLPCLVVPRRRSVASFPGTAVETMPGLSEMGGKAGSC